MTYCLGIRVRDGLICLADGRITSGNQVSNARKISLHGPDSARFAVMTSGLRSLRDKTLAFLDRDSASDHPRGFDTLIDAVQAYCACLRRVAIEDRQALEASDLTFNLHSIIAGQMPGDAEASLFLVYPQGNWVEIDKRTPYLSLGATAYGKPILDRALRYNSPLPLAVKLAYLSFDSTRFSAADVGFPIDILTCIPGPAGPQWRQAHYDYDELREQRDLWNQGIARLAAEMPDGPWLDELLPGSGGTRLSVVRDD